MLNRWTSTLLYVWRSKVRPHDQDSALLQNSSRENARRAALSVLCAKSEHACECLRFAWSSGDLRWGIDERKQRWRRRRSRKGKNSWWGHFCQIMRQRNEKGLQSTTRKDLRRAKTKRHNVPDSRRALHMHVLERDFGIRAACMQHDCATCASMLRDAVTAAQSRFLATSSLKRQTQGRLEEYRFIVEGDVLWSWYKPVPLHVPCTRYPPARSAALSFVATLFAGVDLQGSDERCVSTQLPICADPIFFANECSFSRRIFVIAPNEHLPNVW